MVSERVKSLARFIGIGAASGALVWALTEGGIKSQNAIRAARSAEMPANIANFYEEYDRCLNLLKARGITISAPTFDDYQRREDPLVQISVKTGTRSVMNTIKIGNSTFNSFSDEDVLDDVGEVIGKKPELITKELGERFKATSRKYRLIKPQIDTYYGNISKAGNRALWKGIYSGAKKGAGWGAFAGLLAFGGAAAAKAYSNRRRFSAPKAPKFSRRAMRR